MTLDGARLHLSTGQAFGVGLASAPFLGGRRECNNNTTKVLLNIFSMALPAQHEAALEEVWLVAACGLPASAHLWPIRALEASPLPPPLGPSILAGPSGRVERLLSSGWIGPTYVVTERRESRLGGLPNLTVSAPTDHWTERDWEVAVARICARHIQTIPQMILRHACVTPEAAAVVDEWGSISYAQLVSRAWCVADAIATACVGGDAARGTPTPPLSASPLSAAPLSAPVPSSQLTVGVVFSRNSTLMPVVLLALALRRMIPCHLSLHQAQRNLQLERLRRLGCAAILCESDSVEVELQEVELHDAQCAGMDGRLDRSEGLRSEGLTKHCPIIRIDRYIQNTPTHPTPHSPP